MVSKKGVSSEKIANPAKNPNNIYCQLHPLTQNFGFIWFTPALSKYMNICKKNFCVSKEGILCNILSLMRY